MRLLESSKLQLQCARAAHSR